MTSPPFLQLMLIIWCLIAILWILTSPYDSKIIHATIWQPVAVCPCGYTTPCHNGDLFHLPFDFCPKCDRAKRVMATTLGRHVHSRHKPERFKKAFDHYKWEIKS